LCIQPPIAAPAGGPVPPRPSVEAIAAALQDPASPIGRAVDGDVDFKGSAEDQAAVEDVTTGVADCITG